MPPPGRPRRLLFVNPSLLQGGAETQLAHLAVGLAERGDHVTVACLIAADPAVADRLDRAGVTLVEFGARSRRRKASLLPTLVRLARQADLVHCGLFDASLYGRLAAIVARRPATVAEHSADRSMQVSARGAPRARVIAWHHRLLAPFTAATIACASSQVALLRREGVRAERLAVVPNGVPVAALRAAAAAGGVSREAIGVPAGALVVMQVGRLTPEKAQGLTVQAVAELRRELGEVHAVFVGTGTDGSAPALAQRIGAGWAHFLGARDDVPALLALADIAVLPSRIDTFPMAALEAMAVGVPQVASDVGDLPAIVAPETGGISVPAGDPAALVAACAELLGDPATRGELARRAAAAAADWDVEAMVDRYSVIFDAALHGDPLPLSLRAGPALSSPA